MRDMNRVIGDHDVLFCTFDTLRYDAAVAARARGLTPNLARRLPPWERRHSPATFTYAAHQAFFAGFLPTPVDPGPHPRHFAPRFAGSESTTAHTAVFDAPDIVHGLEGRGYRTVCVGGTGFFNPAHPLGRVLPAYFQEAHWSPALGVTDRASPMNQVAVALGALHGAERVFLFINFSAIHQPNFFYQPGASEDGLESHTLALGAIDAALPPLFQALDARGPWFGLFTSDHGTCYGEDGYWGHRVAHPLVWEVPFATTPA